MTGSGRRHARWIGVGLTCLKDRADGSPGGQGIGPTGRLGGQGPARGQGVGRRTARGTGTESPAGSRTAAGPGQTGSRRSGQRGGPDRQAPQRAIRLGLSANPRSIPSGGSSASARIVGRVLSGLAVVGVVALLLPGLSVLGARVAVDAAGLPVLGAEPTVAGPGSTVALLRGAGVFAVVRLSEGGAVGGGLLRRSGRRLGGCRLVEAGPGGAVALLRGVGVFAVVRLSEGGAVGGGLLRRRDRKSDV